MVCKKYHKITEEEVVLSIELVYGGLDQNAKQVRSQYEVAKMMGINPSTLMDAQRKYF